MKKVATIVFLLMLLMGCKKDPEVTNIDLGYDFFPVDSGLYRLYEVEDIVYDDFNQTIDTNTYEIMEVFSRKLLDLEGNKSFELKRYKRLNESFSWQLLDVWQTTPLATRVEQVEENLRLIKLIFPVAVGADWDGNAFNSLNEEEFEVVSYNADTAIKELNGLSVVRVNHYNEANIIEEKASYERYAKGVGMVNKFFKYLDLQKDSGLIRTLWIKEYGRREAP